MKIHQRKLMFPALFWLGLYLLLSTVMGNIAQTDQQLYLFSALPQLVLALLCFFYLYQTGLSAQIGLTTPAIEKTTTMLYYLPLLLVSCFSLLYGLRTNLSSLTILAFLGMYSGVGFMEEVIFRGLMFDALSRKWNHILVIFFISLTFAIGHIISIVVVEMSVFENFLQIVNAFVVGILFMIVMVSSRNLKACIFAHILYNFLSSISNVGNTPIKIIVFNTVITFLYTFYLWVNAAHFKEYVSINPQLK